jgi:diguanylate cyclase (GGDEF)-like protein
MLRPRRPVCLLIAVLATAVTLHTAVVLQWAQRAERARFEAYALAGARQIGELPGGSCAPAPADSSGDPRLSGFRHWAWGILQDESIIGIGLLDAQNQLLDALPQNVVFPRAALPLAVGAADDARAESIRPGPGQPRLWRVMAAVSGSRDPATQVRLILLGRPGRSLTAALVSAAWLAGGMLAVSGIFLAVSASRFDRNIRQPLQALAAAAATAGADGPAAALAARADEIGAVARVVSDLRHDLRLAEERTQRLERTMHSRVQDQTRQINAQLQRAERAAWIDPLTRLGNRRLLADRLEQIFVAQRRTRADLSIVMLDLDHFKHLNDTCGHAQGDAMLRFVGEMLRGGLRPTDIGVRYGGDEFALVLLDTTAEEAVAIAERFVKLFSQRAAVMKLDPPLSLSAGVASLLRHAPTSGQQLLELADQALLAAKAGGKNRACLRA